MNGVLPYFWITTAVAFGASSLLIALLIRQPRLLPDHPNERSLHIHPTPRTGGIAISVTIVGLWLTSIHQHRLIALAAAVMALVSIIDDWKGLRPLPRFSAQLLITAYVAYAGFGSPTLMEGVFLILTIVWVTNLYNFMDGADGLAGGMTVGGFGSYAIAAWCTGYSDIALISAVILAATLPFLAVNFHPAKIFMGDSGSITLGFLAAAIGVLGWREGAWSPFFPVLVFSPFIADASLTLLHRVIMREKFWQPHRDHYFQKLIRMGYSHRHTAFAEYCAILLSALAGLVSLGLDGPSQLTFVIAWGALLVAVATWIDRRWIEYCASSS